MLRIPSNALAPALLQRTAMPYARHDTQTSAWLPLLRQALQRGETMDQAINRLASLATAAHMSQSLTQPQDKLRNDPPFSDRKVNP